MYQKRIIDKLDRIEEIVNNRVNKKWLSINQVCEYTSLSKSTIHRNIKSGSLKVCQKVGRLIIDIDEVNRWLNE